ncbi:MAG: hypothetical protein LLF76_11060 [Planctomycetaceae bacterium]|nr:hypothetical protein [Planctomycetaceae bacterium]
MRKSICFSLIFVVAVSSVYAAVLTANDPMGSSSFNSAGNWDDGLPPYSSSGYSTMGYLLRTPAIAGDYTFQGSSLVKPVRSLHLIKQAVLYLFYGEMSIGIGFVIGLSWFEERWRFHDNCHTVHTPAKFCLTQTGHSL